MPTYVYETVTAGQSSEQFEVRQAMDEPALTAHPKTGVPVRRIISGGLALISATASGQDAAGPSCGPASCRCGKFD
jgi:predicted nucleic acid-binding Zn ribbon protein